MIHARLEAVQVGAMPFGSRAKATSGRGASGLFDAPTEIPIAFEPARTDAPIMDLQTFVAQTLHQIRSGIAEAKKTHGESIAPTIARNKAAHDPKHILITDRSDDAYMVEFDVAVTVSNQSMSEGGGRLEVLSFVSVGAKGESTAGQTTVSRVKFSVPICYRY
jgi:hypothetical protein